MNPPPLVFRLLPHWNQTPTSGSSRIGILCSLYVSLAMVIMEGMDKTIGTFARLEAMKAEEYRNWQERPAHERMSAVSEITLATYAMKDAAPDVRRLQRTLVHLQRPRR